MHGKKLSPILMTIAAREQSGPCVHRFGDAGAGHFVRKWYTMASNTPICRLLLRRTISCRED